MCGICGAIGIERAELGEEVTRRMMQAIVHRGPDEDGLLVAPSAALGMRRLSIIDLPGGRQPVFNETGDVAVVFNGEIYNFQELRKRLEGLGHKFRTHSDTETIVHAAPEQYAADAPYQLAIIELDGGGRITARIINRAQIGERVRFVEERGGVAFYTK